MRFFNLIKRSLVLAVVGLVAVAAEAADNAPVPVEGLKRITPAKSAADYNLRGDKQSQDVVCCDTNCTFYCSRSETCVLDENAHLKCLD